MHYADVDSCGLRCCGSIVSLFGIKEQLRRVVLPRWLPVTSHSMSLGAQDELRPDEIRTGTYVEEEAKRLSSFESRLASGYDRNTIPPLFFFSFVSQNNLPSHWYLIFPPISCIRCNICCFAQIFLLYEVLRLKNQTVCQVWKNVNNKIVASGP